MLLTPEALQYPLFKPLEGQDFLIPLADRTVPLTLVAVVLAGKRRPEAGRDPFVLNFRGAPGLRLPQSIYRLTNATLGDTEFFLTQNADGAQGSEFEAIFS